jgi:adenylosuccinate lyase
MAAVQAGGDRQLLHEQIRIHSQAAAEQVKMHGRSNDLIGRLKNDVAFNPVDIDALMRPIDFVGRAPQQVDEFIETKVAPVLEKYKHLLGEGSELKV